MGVDFLQPSSEVKVTNVVISKDNLRLAVWIERVDHAEKPLQNNKKNLRW